MTRIAVFTDTDLHVSNDLAAALKAVMRHAPDDLRPRVFTSADLPADTEDYFAAASVSLALPWSPQHRVFWPRLRPFARQLRAAGTELVHITTGGPVGLAGHWLARRAGVPLVGSVHTPVLPNRGAGGLRSHVGALVDRLTRHAYDGCAPVLAPSRAARDVLAARGFTSLETWERGVDTRTFAPHRASPALRDAWHVDHRRPAIFVPLASLTLRETAMIEPIRRRLHRHALAHQFVFVGHERAGIDVESLCPDGVLIDDPSDDHLATALASADLLLFPGASDVAGGSVLEAQACGLPAIVADAGGAMEQIVPGTTGCLARAGDVEAFVSCAVDLLRHPGRRTDMGRAARAHALERDWPAMLRPLHEAWRSALRPAAMPLPQSTSNEAA